MRDYKDWIQNKAEDLANAENAEFNDLPSDKRDAIYNQACELYKDHLADEIDAIYERMR